MIGELLMRAAGAISGILVVASGLALLYLWLAAVADLLWATFLRPTPVVTISSTAFALCLTATSGADDMRAALAMTIFFSPMLAWALLNIWTWLASPRDQQPEAPSFRGFFRARWFNAFHDAESARQRNSYVAPVILLDGSDEH